MAVRLDALPSGLGQRFEVGEVKARSRGRGGPWAPPSLNPAGVEQLRELFEVAALLFECTVASTASTPTTERAFENSGVAVGQLRERVRVLAVLLRAKSRLVKGE